MTRQKKTGDKITAANGAAPSILLSQDVGFGGSVHSVPFSQTRSRLPPCTPRFRLTVWLEDQKYDLITSLATLPGMILKSGCKMWQRIRHARRPRSIMSMSPMILGLVRSFGAMIGGHGSIPCIARAEIRASAKNIAHPGKQRNCSRRSRTRDNGCKSETLLLCHRQSATKYIC